MEFSQLFAQIARQIRIYVLDVTDGGFGQVVDGCADGNGGAAAADDAESSNGQFINSPS